jgi:hypothetical protein
MAYISNAFVFLGERSYEEDAQILRVIEAYCTSAKTRYTVNSGMWSLLFSYVHGAYHRHKTGILAAARC